MRFRLEVKKETGHAKSKPTKMIFQNYAHAQFYTRV